MFASFEKYKLHIEMLPFFHEFDYGKSPIHAQNQKLLDLVERNTSHSIEAANKAVVAHAKKMVEWFNEHRNALTCIQCPPLPEEPAFVAEHVRTLKKLILNPKVPVAELQDPQGMFQKTLSELKTFSYAKPYTIPPETTRKQVDEIQAFYDGFQRLFDEFIRLVNVRNLTVDMGDYALGLLEEKVQQDNNRGRQYWRDKKVQWIQELHECEKAYFHALKSLPLDISAEEEDRIYSIIGNRNSAYYNDGNEDEHKAVKEEMQSYFAKRIGDIIDFPIAGVEAVYTPKGAPQQKFRFPICINRREMIYLIADCEQQGESLHWVFDTLLAQFLRGTNAGEMEINVVDSVYNGDFVTKFQAALTPEKKGDKPAAHIDLLTSRDSNALKDFLKKYQEQNITRTIRTLGDQYEFIEDFNKKNPTLPISRKFLLINGLDRFFNISSLNAASDLQNLMDILNESARCGIFVVLTGSADFLKFMKGKADAALSSMRCIGFSPKSKNELLIPNMSENVQFEHPDFKLTSTLQLLQTTPEEIERLCIGLREIQGSVDLSVNLADIIGETGGLFSCAAYNRLKVPFGKNARGEVINWYCDRETAGHTLIVGGTGSGKSNLLHCMITSACYLHRPEEFQIYLIDLKKGVEFKRYVDSGLPHARVVAIEGDAEMALGVLESVYKLYEHNSETMKKYDAVDLENLWNNGGKAPRISLIIDEFQLLFENDDTRQEAARYLEKLIKEGRAAGFNVILATQNPDKVPSGIKGNQLTRIVMKNKREIFNEVAGLNNKDFYDQVTRPGDFLFIPENSSEPVLGRTALIKRDYQTELLGEIASASSAKLNFETLVYDSTAFPSGSSRIFRRMLTKSAEQEHPTFVLGENRSLNGCVYCILEENAGENLLVAGNHGGQQDLNEALDWEDDEFSDEAGGNAVSCASAVYWTLSRSLNTLLANGGFKLAVFDRQKFLLPHLVQMPECKELHNARELGNEIFELYDQAKECEKNGTVLSEWRMLAILNAQTLRQLHDMKRPSAAVAAAPVQTIKTVNFNLSAPAARTGTDVDNASAALRYLLQNGPQFHVNILMGTNNADILKKEVLWLGGSCLKDLFRHIICMQMSRDDLSGLLGTIPFHLTDMGPRYAFYANELISARPQRFRPYFEANNN